MRLAYPLSYPALGTSRDSDHAASAAMFVTADAASIQAVLAHTAAAPARDPPAWASDIDAGGVLYPQGERTGTICWPRPSPSPSSTR